MVKKGGPNGKRFIIQIKKKRKRILADFFQTEANAKN